MSRGGRGGGRGGGAGGKPQIPMGQLTFQDLAGLDKAENLYPYMSNLPRPSEPTRRETRAADLQLEYLDFMRKSPYWPVATQRKVKELPRYTDRYRPEEQDRPSLRSVNLQRAVFPREVWRIYMQGETRREDLRAKAKARRTNLIHNFNWDEYERQGGGEGGVGDADGAAGDDAADGAAAGDGEDDDEFADPEAMDDYENEEDDDYAQNYFDNGEDDAGDDDGGGGEAYE